MKHSFRSLTSGALMAAVALMAAGCSNEENTSSTYVPEGTPITVNAVVGEMQTKAGYSDDNLPKTFYLKIEHPTRESFSYYAQMTYNNGAWESYDGKDSSHPELKMYWAGDDKKVKVTAATYDFNLYLAPNVQTDQSTSVDSSDELIMETDADVAPATDGSIEVKLKHMMAKLIVKIDLGKQTGYTANPITDFVVGGTQTRREFSFDDFEFTGSIDGTVADIKAYTDAKTMFTPSTLENGEPTAAATVSYEAILVPQEVTSGALEINFSLGDKSYNWTSTKDFTFDSNTQYTLNLKMIGDKLAMKDVTIGEWSSTPQDLGTGELAEAESIPVLEIDANTLRVTETRINEVLKNGKLKIKGKIKAEDVTALAQNKTIEVLDLSEVEAANESEFSINKISFYYNNKGNTTLKEVKMPESMTTIGELCFAGCTNLQTVTLPTDLKEIGGYAFYGAGITEITIPASVTAIETYTFYQCEKLAKVTFKGNIQSIGSNAFYECKALTEITLPSTVTSIGQYAFRGCSSLAKVTFSSPSKLNSLGASAFIYCSSLAEITLPSGVTSIPESAFSSCSKLKKVTCEGNVTSIGKSAFSCGEDTGLFADLYLTYNTALPVLSGSGNFSSTKANPLKVHLNENLFNSYATDANSNYSYWKTLVETDGTVTFVKN